VIVENQIALELWHANDDRVVQCRVAGPIQARINEGDATEYAKILGCIALGKEFNAVVGLRTEDFIRIVGQIGTCQRACLEEGKSLYLNGPNDVTSTDKSTFVYEIPLVMKLTTY
jgi:hypothetical protein